MHLTKLGEAKYAKELYQLQELVGKLELCWKRCSDSLLTEILELLPEITKRTFLNILNTDNIACSYV